MTLHRCADCPELTTRARCPQHEREKDRARGTRHERGYGSKHVAHRDSLKPDVEAGLAVCWRCNERITVGEPWDDGHDDRHPDRYRGPEHVSCNRAAPRISPDA